MPREWNIRDAWVKNVRGERVIDFQRSNLHVVNYSVPVRRKVTIEELRQHLHTLPDHPDWIPYRTSYYKEDWGFCLAHKQLQELQDAEYEVCIDSTLEDGSLTYGEYYLPGKRGDEVLLSCHACHPSLCNDNLSGVALVAQLARFSPRLASTIPTGSSSSPEPSARSPGSPSTKTRYRRSGTAWLWPASATRGSSITSGHARATPRSIVPRSTP